MNIYVIYKFDDHALVKETVENIQKTIPAGNSLFMFEPNRKSKFWRLHAKRKIKESQMVILFDSLSGDKTTVGKHISWELKQAEKHGKRIVIFKTDPEALNRFWYESGYSEQGPRQSKHKTVPLQEAIPFMEKECSWQMDHNLLHKASTEALTDAEMQLLLAQYRIMIDTSEKLMERRQQTVSLYITLCTALIALIGAAFSLNNANVCAFIVLVSGFILWTLCTNWKLSLESYDLNNRGKFAVINVLEKYLPAEIFECEYRYTKLSGMRPFSAREIVLPRIFTALSIALMGGAAAYFTYHYLWGAFLSCYEWLLALLAG